MLASRKYPQEVRDRAVRMVNEQLTAEPALAVTTVCRLVGDQLGINKNTLRNRVKQSHSAGGVGGMSTDENHDELGVEAICRTLSESGVQVAASSCYGRTLRPASKRSVSDAKWDERIAETDTANRGLFGARTM